LKKSGLAVGGIRFAKNRRHGMVIDRLDRWTERALALLDSPEGKQIYKRNKYEFTLGRKKNICGIIEKACGRLKYENLIAVYERVEGELAARKEQRIAG
jgi:hypothetical protein